MSEPSLLISPDRKGRGRPRVTEPRVKVDAWILSEQRRALVQLANDSGVSVSGLIRALVSRELRRRQR